MNQFYGSFAMFFSATLSLCSSALRFSLCASMSPAVNLRTGKGIALNLLSCVALLATASRVPAMQLRNWQSGGIFAHSRRLCVNSAARLVSPTDFLRFSARKILNSAPISLLPADSFGGNFLFCINFNALCNLSINRICLYTFLAPST
jgi:hypothetical protein